MSERTIYYYKWTTRLGPISLIPEPNGRYKVMIEDECMGSYHSPEAAAEDVAGDHLGSTPFNVDLDRLGISGDLGDWSRLVFAKITGMRR